MEKKEMDELLSNVEKTVADKFKASVDTFKEDFNGEQKETVENAVKEALKSLLGS